ncbi:MAG: hypothetical protein LUE90_07780 [Clostridiales bacterium]|nr:hypothetical protein [Clostridiales bacterium]
MAQEKKASEYTKRMQETKYYVLIPDNITYILSMSEERLFRHLVHQINLNRRIQSYSDLSRISLLGEQTVKNAVKKLKLIGFLDYQQTFNGGKNKYKLNYERIKSVINTINEIQSIKEKIEYGKSLSVSKTDTSDVQGKTLNIQGCTVNEQGLDIKYIGSDTTDIQHIKEDINELYINKNNNEYITNEQFYDNNIDSDIWDEEEDIFESLDDYNSNNESCVDVIGIMISNLKSKNLKSKSNIDVNPCIESNTDTISHYSNEINKITTNSNKDNKTALDDFEIIRDKFDSIYQRYPIREFTKGSSTHRQIQDEIDTIIKENNINDLPKEQFRILYKEMDDLLSLAK